MLSLPGLSLPFLLVGKQKTEMVGRKGETLVGKFDVNSCNVYQSMNKHEWHLNHSFLLIVELFFFCTLSILPWNKHVPWKSMVGRCIPYWKWTVSIAIFGLIVTFQKHRQLCEHGVWKSPRKSAAELFDALAGVKDGRVTMVHWRAFVKP